MKLYISQRIPDSWSTRWMAESFRAIETLVNNLAEGRITARYTAYTAAPTTGSWKRGDIVWNSEPNSGGFIGFVCTVSGTPGTWKGFGTIA